MNSILAQAWNWIDRRTGMGKMLHEALYENVPGGSRWRYVWGSTLVFAFVTQAITGIFLWMAYSPSRQTAWESVYFIQFHMQGGWLLRGIHHFMAQVMVVLLAIHLVQVVWDKAYLAPREFNFWNGLVLMLVVLGLSLTGYLLPWDQKGYWATKVATNLMSLTPAAGAEVQLAAVGGNEYGHHTLTRFFAMHAGVLPALLVILLVMHLTLFRRHGITAKLPLKGPAEFFWPGQVFKDAVACMAVLTLVLLCAVHFDIQGVLTGNLPEEHRGAELGAPADNSELNAAARPEWYFLFLFQLLKYFKSEFVGAIVVPGLIMAFLFLMPILGNWSWGRALNLVGLALLLCGAGLLTYKALEQDNYHLWNRYDPEKYADDDLLREKYEAPFVASSAFHDAVVQGEHEALRTRELIEMAGGIDKGGALEMVRADPEIQGRRLFVRHCGSCHSFQASNVANLTEFQQRKLSAPNLYRFASREWIAGLLDPQQIKTLQYFGPTKHAKGEMANFVAKEMKVATPAQQTARDEIIAALSAEAALVYQSNLDRDANANEIVARGRKAMAANVLSDNSTCLDCHEFRGEGGGDGPVLTGYGSAKWLTDMISNPAHSKFYGERNDRMPAFAKEADESRNQLSADDLELIVRFIRSDDVANPAAK